MTKTNLFDGLTDLVVLVGALFLLPIFAEGDALPTVGDSVIQGVIRPLRKEQLCDLTNSNNG